MPPEIMNLLMQYDLATGNAARDEIAIKLVQATERWYASGGHAAVDKIKTITNTLQRHKANPELIRRVREGAPQIKKVLDTAQKIAPQASRVQLWQELIRLARAAAGGAQNFARMILNAGSNIARGGLNLGRDVMTAGVAAATAAVSGVGGVIARAVGAAVATLGGWEVVLGILAAAALVGLLYWCFTSYQSPRQHEIRDPLLRRLDGSAIQLKPMLGNA